MIGYDCYFGIYTLCVSSYTMVHCIGMVSVCAGCDAYYPWVAASLGSIAGLIYLFCSSLLVKLKIDDPLDASPIHLGAGKCQIFIV